MKKPLSFFKNNAKQFSFSTYWHRIALVTLLCACLASVASAQVTKQWDKTFGAYASLYDIAFSTMIPTPDGGYLLGGLTEQPGIWEDKTEPSRGERDYWIVKIDANGNKIWDKTFGGSSYEDLTAIVTTTDGGYLLGGSSISGKSGDKTEASRGSGDYWLVKIDAQGNKLWDKTIGGNRSDVLSSIVNTSDGGYLLGGYSSSDISGDKTEASRGNNDYWVVKIDAQGNKLWDKTLGGNKGDVFTALLPSTDGGYLLGGYSESDISGEKSQPNLGFCRDALYCTEDYWVVKINSNGVKVWDKTFGGNEREILNTIINTPDGNYLLGGYSESDVSGTKSQDKNGYWIVKIDNNGQEIWNKTFGGNGFYGLRSIVANDEGYLLGGYSYAGIDTDKTEAGRGSADYWIVQVSADGTTKLWDKTFGGPSSISMGSDDSFDMLKTILPTADGGYLLGGTSFSGTGNEKSDDKYGYWIIKIKRNPPLTLSPVADAYVQNGSYAKTNYGKAPELVVKSAFRSGYSRSAYLKFSLGSVNQESSVSSAKLRIYGNNTENTVGINAAVYGVSNDAWTEEGITWNKAPAVSGTILSSVEVNNQARYYELDVTSFVQAQLAGDKVVSLVVKDPSNQNRNLTFNSKENAANPPQLIIESLPVSTVRLNSGGEVVSTTMGSFSADTSFFGATSITTTTAAIANTTNDALYQSTRKAAVSGGYFAYNVPVTIGTYTVKLHFAEIAFVAAGKRKFNVTVDGNPWLTNYDIFVAAGGAKKAVVATKTITVTDGMLNLYFSSVVDKASVAAIEIVPVTPGARVVQDIKAAAQTDQQMSLYPNPATDKVTVKLAQPAQQVSTTITDLTGAVHSRNTHRKTDETTLEIPVAALPPSVYLLQLTTEQGQQTLKFIKK